MHVLFSHRLFPAQFGQIARYLIQRSGVECTFVCEKPTPRDPAAPPLHYLPDFAAGVELAATAPVKASEFVLKSFVSPAQKQAPAPEQFIEGIRRIQYAGVGGEGSFESHFTRGLAIARILKAHPDLKFDLVVGPCIYASALFLPEVTSAPVINYLDYYFRPEDSFVGFRPEFPPTEMEIIRARAHNALVLYDLHHCAAAYSPTEWQRKLYPAAYQSKIQTIFDGVDRSFWYRRTMPRTLGGRPVPAETRIVTYVARGLESLRGFDIFMKVAKRICDVRSDVLFVVVGSDNFYHGSDLNYIKEKTFKEHVLRRDKYDLSRFVFAGRIPSSELVQVLSVSDLHFYLTAPFVLSWSLFDAMACGCTVLASDTTPVREVIRHEENGLLAGFFDVDGLTRLALRVLDSPAAAAPLAAAAVRTIDEKYSLEKAVSQLHQLFERVQRGLDLRT